MFYCEGFDLGQSKVGIVLNLNHYLVFFPDVLINARLSYVTKFYRFKIGHLLLLSCYNAVIA